ncbi:MAG: hypothetical protein MH132_05055 [Hydrotalea sp.]|nr:hypothetical protein [Hydrotalea sp.]
MTRYILIVLFTMTLHNSSAQTLDKYADQLHFGILSYQPDSSITAFLTKYVPVVFKKFEAGGWTAYPPDTIKEPPFTKVTNSYVFQKHPYFDGHFKVGQLAITQKIYADEKWFDNITDIKLWFEFDNAGDAKKAFQKMIDNFSSFNVLKRITSQQGLDKAEFTDKISDKYYSSVQIILVKDYLLGKRLAKPSNEGFKCKMTSGYKLLVELGNDLY